MRTKRPFTLEEIAQVTGATVERGGPAIRGVSPPERAEPGDLAVIADARNERLLSSSRASALLLKAARPELPHAQLIHPDPMQALITLLEMLGSSDARPSGIHPTAVVALTARLGEHVRLGPQVVVEANAVIEDHVQVGAGCFIGEGVHVGSETILHPRVTLLQGVTVGARVIIQSGSVVGADGFGYRWSGTAHTKIPQLGSVVIEDDVHLGACCTIDRATLGETRIGARTRIDNLVHVGHNVQVGADCLLVAQVGIAGSAVIGDRAVLAGQVGVADHSVIGAGAVVGAQSGVHGRVAPGEVVSGTPILPHRVWRRVSAALPRLPELIRQLRAVAVPALAVGLPGLSETPSSPPDFAPPEQHGQVG